MSVDFSEWSAAQTPVVTILVLAAIAMSADEMRQWAKSTADLLRLGFGAMDEKEARRWSTPPSL